MSDAQPSSAQQLIGDFAPKLVDLTDGVLFGDIWRRDGLSPRDRSLITITALVAGGNVEQLPFHLKLGTENGLTEDEIVEAITHLAFYSGWPKAMSAITTAKQTFTDS
ncbi:carboxymuconolactone decarboxylase family protein [Microbacterium sp. P05]|uniref:carboxymuconolactone decarboxylase family protein n=1 Tax=Microbacterium sp. P05 TaxID=3366948 RepID=UPI0037464F02